MDKIGFWDEKIIPWENARYFRKTANLPWLEKFASRASSSLKYRQSLAAEILKSYAHDKTILEAGCGSGSILRALAHTQARKLIGIDFSKVAIENALRPSDRFNFQKKIEFLTGDITKITLPNFDIFVALGLLDWLSPGEIRQLLTQIKGKMFLISFSEKRFSFQQFLHKLYVWISYGRKNNGYQPQYYSLEKITLLLKQHGFEKIKVTRDKRLSFSIILHNLTSAN